MRVRWCTRALCLVSCLAGSLAKALPQTAQPLSPQDAQQAFVLHPDCRIELVACEPDVIDPVHIAFAPDGRLWVVEYSDYPHGPKEGQPGLSRIRVLSDSDGDGTYGDAVTFAEGLIFANGLLHWRDGVIVTTNGQVLFLRDTDGDGVCDDTQQWFTGFATENPQLRCNHPTLGPDNKIYIANGLRGGAILPGKDYPWDRPEDVKPLSISGRDFRFDPLTGQYETISGNGQFGLSFDDRGHRFVCSNRNPCNHIVLEEEDLRRAPYLRTSRIFEEASPAGEQSRLYPISRTWTTSNLHANQFTAACGVIIYRGDALGHSEFYGNSFTCEPTGNLVHRDVLTPTGVTFTSRPGRAEIEFLATQDEWFRPVNLAHGPDGALYVVDMYRAVIEHPQFVPEELKNRPDQMLGIDKGRLWRIVANKNTSAAPHPLPTATPSAEELIQLLDHPNVWQRETAQRLLVEQGAWKPEFVSRLQQHTPLTPVEQLGALWRTADPQTLDWKDFLKQAKATGLMNDPWFPVVLQVLAGDDPALLVREVGTSLGMEPLHEFVRAVGRKNNSAEVQALLSNILPRGQAELSAVATMLVGLSEGLPQGRTALAGHLKQLPPPEQQQFVKLVTQAREKLVDKASSPTESELLIAIQGLADDPESLEFLASALSTMVSQQQAVIAALSQRPEPAAGSALAEAIPQLSVSARNQAMSALAGSTSRIHLLLDLVESGQVPPLTVDPNLAKRLMASRAADIKERAERLLKTAPPADRVQVLADYTACLTLSSNPQRGREIFIKNCATCHRVGDVGVNVAPDISDSRTKTPEYLLTNILDPNRAIDNNFFSYTIVDTSGRVFTGVIESETSTTVTLKQPEAKTVSFARSDIEEMKNNGVSLMPVGLERTISPQEMADLISFIKNWRYLDGSVPEEVIRK